MFSGFLPIYKPAGISSFDVIRHIYRLLRNKLHIPKKSQKIGHTGTLDPFAQGVLLLAFGKATRLIEYGLHKHKTYIFTLKFGEQTDTADKEGKIIASNNIMPSEGDILTSIPYFIGEITQIPPRFSAVKIAGKPAYKLARTGQDFTIKPRTTFIKQLRLLTIKDDYAMFQCEALAGTYIRSLAEDLAKRAGAIGHLTYLEREKDGIFTTKDCLDLASITALISGKNIDGDIAVDMEDDVGDDVKNRIIQNLESNLYPLKTYLEDGNLHIQNYDLSEFRHIVKSTAETSKLLTDVKNGKKIALINTILTPIAHTTPIAKRPVANQVISLEHENKLIAIGRIITQLGANGNNGDLDLIFKPDKVFI